MEKEETHNEETEEKKCREDNEEEHGRIRRDRCWMWLEVSERDRRKKTNYLYYQRSSLLLAIVCRPGRKG